MKRKILWTVTITKTILEEGIRIPGYTKKQFSLPKTAVLTETKSNTTISGLPIKK